MQYKKYHVLQVNTYQQNNQFYKPFPLQIMNSKYNNQLNNAHKYLKFYNNSYYMPTNNYLN